jgi:hypothetical protein
MLATASFAFVPAAHAEYDAPSSEGQAAASYIADQTVGAEDQTAGQDRLLIFDRNKRRVIYDDGRNDLFCATGVYVAGYTWNGYPIYRRNMRCR